MKTMYYLLLLCLVCFILPDISYAEPSTATGLIMKKALEEVLSQGAKAYLAQNYPTEAKKKVQASYSKAKGNLASLHILQDKSHKKKLDAILKATSPGQQRDHKLKAWNDQYKEMRQQQSADVSAMADEYKDICAILDVRIQQLISEGKIKIKNY